MAIAPRAQRNVTRMWAYRRRPLNWTWRAIGTWMPLRHAGVAAGTQRTRVRRGGAWRAWAVAGTSAGPSANAARSPAVRRPTTKAHNAPDAAELP